MYAISIEAKQAKLAPIKFSKIKLKSVFLILPTTLIVFEKRQ